MSRRNRKKDWQSNYVIGTVLDFQAPTGSDPKIVPIVQVAIGKDKIWIRWNESAETICLMGEPMVGSSAIITMPKSGGVENGLAKRFSGVGEIRPDYKNDDRVGLTKSLSSKFNPSSKSKGSSPYSNKRILGVPGSDVQVVVDEKQSVLKGGESNRIVSDKEAGNIINGPLSIGCGFQEFRIGGFWTLNPMMQAMIPSTIVTPIPTFIFQLPTAGLKGMMSIVKELKDFII